MATETKAVSKTYFRIKGYPGPFRLASEWMRKLENYDNRMIVDLTICLAEKEGQEFLGYNKSGVAFKARFEVALMGSTSAYATVMSGGPAGVRLLGRFLAGADLRDQLEMRVDALCGKIHKAIWEIETQLHKWQWEVVFNPTNRHDEAIGFVNKLDTPLPDEWTR